MQDDNIREDIKRRLEEGDYSCSKELTLSIISGKWKVVILYHLYYDGDYHFNELMRLLPKIRHKVLTNQLRELEEDEIITRKELVRNNRKYVIYSLTELGETIMPIVDGMYEWGENRIKQLKISANFNINTFRE